jgi:hypothetical protein
MQWLASSESNEYCYQKPIMFEVRQVKKEDRLIDYFAKRPFEENLEKPVKTENCNCLNPSRLNLEEGLLAIELARGWIRHKKIEA